LLQVWGWNKLKSRYTVLPLLHPSWSKGLENKWIRLCL
jgi:hypothetical protein